MGGTSLLEAANVSLFLEAANVSLFLETVDGSSLLEANVSSLLEADDGTFITSALYTFFVFPHATTNLLFERSHSHGPSIAPLDKDLLHLKLVDQRGTHRTKSHTVYAST